MILKNIDTYPTLNDLKATNLSYFLTESLKIFIDTLIKSTDAKKKCNHTSFTPMS